MRIAVAPRVVFISSVKSSMACSSSSFRFVSLSIADATASALEFVNHSLGPFELKKPNDNTLPIRPKTESKRPPIPSTRMCSNILNMFSGRSKMASIRLPMASNMLATRSSIQRRLMSSVKDDNTPVTKLLMAFAISKINFGICATIPTTLPKPLDRILFKLLPTDDNASPIAFDRVPPILFAIPSPI